MSVDIWPELDWSKATRTPRTVMLEQSDVLMKKSGGLLRLGVTVRQIKLDRFPDGAFVCDAYISATKLSYNLDLLEVYHSVAAPYPAQLRVAREQDALEVKDEAEFVEQLRRILSSPRWIESMDRMIAMSNS
jgi:hypothetical protein